jgi:hypothetical protein
MRAGFFCGEIILEASIPSPGFCSGLPGRAGLRHKRWFNGVWFITRSFVVLLVRLNGFGGLHRTRGLVFIWSLY